MQSKFLLILSLIIFFSCANDDDIPITGDFEALKNGEVWNGYIETNVLDDGRVQVHFTHDNPNGEDLKYISFFPFPRSEGNVEWKTLVFGEYGDYPTSNYSSMIESDVLGDSFRLVEDHPDNHFEITSYKKRNGKVEGTFSLTYKFYDRRDPVDVTEPDSIISFTNGSFSFKIKD